MIAGEFHRLKLSCKLSDEHGVDVCICFCQVDGTILAHTGSPAWRSGVLTQWLEFKNVRGITIQGCGTVDGQGSHWWSGGGSAAGDAEMVTEEKSFGHPSHATHAELPVVVGFCRSWTPIVPEQATTDQQ